MIMYYANKVVRLRGNERVATAQGKRAVSMVNLSRQGKHREII